MWEESPYLEAGVGWVPPPAKSKFKKGLCGRAYFWLQREPVCSCHSDVVDCGIRGGLGELRLEGTHLGKFSLPEVWSGVLFSAGRVSQDITLGGYKF